MKIKISDIYHEMKWNGMVAKEEEEKMLPTHTWIRVLV